MTCIDQVEDATQEQSSPASGEQSYHALNAAAKTVTVATIMNPESTLDDLSGPCCVNEPFHTATTADFPTVVQQSAI